MFTIHHYLTAAPKKVKQTKIIMLWLFTLCKEAYKNLGLYFNMCLKMSKFSLIVLINFSCRIKTAINKKYSKILLLFLNLIAFLFIVCACKNIILSKTNVYTIVFFYKSLKIFSFNFLVIKPCFFFVFFPPIIFLRPKGRKVYFWCHM